MQPSKLRTGFTAAVLLILFAAVLTACGGKGDPEPIGDPEKIVAVYQGGEVSEQEFNRYYYVDKFLFASMHDYYEQIAPEEFKRHMLESYISFKILGERASEEISSRTEGEVDERMVQFEEELSADEAATQSWEEKSKEWGLKKDDIKQYILLQAKALNHIRSLVTEERIQEIYHTALAENPHAYTTATVRHVLVAFEPEGGEPRSKEAALERAQEIKSLLESGEDFAEVAESYSDDPGSKNNGGRYEAVNVNNWVEPFKEAVLELDIGTISEPVETAYGYHVIQVEERAVPGLDELRDQLEGQAIDEYYKVFVNDELPALIEEIKL